MISDTRRVDNVETAMAVCIPELLKTLLRFGREFFVSIAGFSEESRKSCHRSKRVDPKGINLHRLASSRCDDPVADFCVHPRELHTGTSGIEKPVGRIDTDVVARSRNVRIDHAGKNGEKFLQCRGILSRRETLP